MTTVTVDDPKLLADEKIQQLQKLGTKIVVKKPPEFPVIVVSELKSFDTGVKHRVRTEERKFLRQTILKQKQAKDLHVLCLPSSEALEVTDIYDVLGIPRRNIVGVERDHARYEILNERKLGMTTIRADLTDLFDKNFFLNSYDAGHFDIINLDLQSYYSMEVFDMIEAIAGQRLLADDSVFMITYLKGRENELAQNLVSLEIFLSRLYEAIAWAKQSSDWEKIKHRGVSPHQLLDGKIDDKFFRERGFVDCMIIDQFMGLYNTAQPLYEEIKKDERFDIGPQFDPLIKTLSEGLLGQMTQGWCMAPKKVCRLAYQSGHSPMRVLMMHLERVRSQTDFYTHYAFLGKYKKTPPPCVTISPPKISNQQEPCAVSAAKTRIMELIKKGEYTIQDEATCESGNV